MPTGRARRRYCSLALSAYLLVVICLAAPAVAHNGALTAAYRVEGITVDGDLSDWPDSLARLAIARVEHGDMPLDEADLTAWFRVACSPRESAVYLAVEVADGSPMVDDPRDQTFEQDGCEICVAVDHHSRPWEQQSTGSHSGVIQVGVWGQHELANLGGGSREVGLTPHPTWVDVSWRHTSAGHVYEWRFDLLSMAAESGLDAQPSDVGLDIAIPDLDEDGSFSWIAWGPRTEKFIDLRHTGDLILAGGDPGSTAAHPAIGATGRVKGTARWPSGAPATISICFESSDGAGRYFSLWPDSAGALSARLPEGEYTLGSALWHWYSSGALARAGSASQRRPLRSGPRTIRVTSQTPVHLELTLDPPTGRTVAAGPGQTAVAGPGSWVGPWHSLTPGDGLPGGVSTLCRDAAGVLWLGTNFFSGVTRFDGQTITTLTPDDGLPEAGVTTLAADPSGPVWLGTDAGLVRYDGQDLTFFGDGLPPGHISALATDYRGDLWIGTAGGRLTRYDGEHFREMGPREGVWGGNAAVRDLEVAADGDLWVATGGSGVYRYDGRRIHRVEAIADSNVFRVVQAPDGALWLALGSGDPGAGGGVLRYDDGVITRFGAADGLADDQVKQILPLDDGTVWFATWNGLSQYDGSSWTTYRAADGLGHDVVDDLALDAAGRPWVGTWRGLSCYDRDRIIQYTTVDGLASDDIVGLEADGDGLWIAHRLGDLTRYNGETFEAILRPVEDRMWALHMRRDVRGDVWLAGSDGVWRLDGREFLSQTDDQSLWAVGMTPSRDGGMWVAGLGVVAYLDGDSVAVLGSDDGLPASWDQRESWALGVLEDANGDVWFGHEDGALSRWDGEQFTVHQSGTSGILAMMRSADGDLWLGGAFGAGRFDGEDFDTYPMPGQVWQIVRHSNGQLWFCTGSGGIVRYDGKAFQRLTERDGLPGGAANAAVESASGGMWIGTSRGLVHYQLEDEPPTVQVENVIADREYGAADRIELTNQQDVLSFLLASRSLTTMPDQMVYLCRLRGYDDEWRQSDAPRVEYRDLPRGDYVFEVQAVDRDLNYSTESATVQVSVTLPYERLSLLAALGVALLLVAWQGTRAVQRGQRLRSANRNLQERTEQVEAANAQVREATRNKSEFLRRMSHDLRSPMNAIIGYTRLVLRKAQGSLDDRQVRNLENIQTSADNLLNLINDILDLSRIEAGHIELQPRETDVRQLVEECADALAPLAKPGVELVRQIERVPPVETDPDRLRQVVMNLLGNAAKFTDEGSITVSLRTAGDGARIEVADTGVGIPAKDLPHIFDEFRQVARQGGEQTEGTGLGLSIARKIVELLGGTISAESEVGAGTTFTVHLPSAATA